MSVISDALSSQTFHEHNDMRAIFINIVQKFQVLKLSEK